MWNGLPHRRKFTDKIKNSTYFQRINFLYSIKKRPHFPKVCLGYLKSDIHPLHKIMKKFNIKDRGAVAIVKFTTIVNPALNFCTSINFKIHQSFLLIWWVAVLFRIRIFGVQSGRIMRFVWIRSRIGYHFCSSRIRIRIIQNVLNTF